MDLKKLLAAASKKTVRDYSTRDFGREPVEKAISVVVKRGKARALIAKLRKTLPPRTMAFMETTRWLGKEKHFDGGEIVVAPGPRRPTAATTGSGPTI